MTNNQKLNASWLLLKITYTIVPIVAGLDKFFNKLTYWPQYLNPHIAQALPLSTLTIMQAVGIIEIVAGILVLTKTRIGAYVVELWLVTIAFSLFAMEKYFDIAIRDLVMANGALALAWLSEIKES